MKIGIDISQVVYGTGVSTYTSNLVKNLLELDKQNEYILFGGYLRRKYDLEEFVSSLQGNFKKVFFPIPPTFADLIWNKLHILPIENIIGPVDIFHSSDWSQPPSSAFKVTTIHDLVPLLYPTQTEPRLVKAHIRRLEVVKNEVDRVVVPSLTTKNDLILYGVDEAKIIVISEAPDPMFRHTNKREINRVKNKYRIDGNYFLSVGSAKRKNIERIIKAYENLASKIKLKLIIVGISQQKFRTVKGVKTLGHVVKKDLPALYSGSAALVYPSLYEGFGLPILEAFACKVPVITSNVGSMKEITQDAAILVNPENVAEISRAMKEVIGNHEKYVDLGQKRLKYYSWQKNALSTLKVYEEYNK
jgi:glycosyltransferase involved in cell wall biosynthesis